MGGLVHFDEQTTAHMDRAGRGCFVRDGYPMTGVSFTVWRGFRYLLILKHNKQFVLALAGRDSMCRGSNVKDKHVNAFQLESLILAQNERWRQA